MNKARKPNLAGGEVAIKLTVNIGDDNFHDPLASAVLDVPDGLIIQQVEVEVELEEE